MKLKTLHIIWSARFGGIEKLVFDLANEQYCNDKCEVTVAACKKGGQFEERFLRAEFPFKKGFLTHTLQLFSYYKLIEEIKKNDLVHLHQFNPIVALLCILFSKKTIYTEHGNFGVGRTKKKGEWLLLILQRLFLEKKVDAIIFNSMFTQAYAKKRYDVKDKGIVIHNGFTPAPEMQMQMQNEYALNWKQKLKDSFVIGCISRFAGVKRLDQLIYTFSLVEDQQIKLLLVGDGGLRDQLEQQVRDLGIADKVIFAGYQENTSFFYQQMDLCVIPSKHESFGLVVVEALNEGKPVLVFSDGGGMIDIVQPLNEKTIANNPSEMAQLVLHWKNHPELSINGVEARRKRANEFSISIMEAKTLKLYRDVWN